MKKLNLKTLNLDPKDLLRKDQLKAIFGGGYAGDGSSSCEVKCKNPKGGDDITLECVGPRCSAIDYKGCTTDTESLTCSSIVVIG